MKQDNKNGLYNKNGLFYREKFFEEINGRFEMIEKRLEAIEENHLPHLHEEIADLKVVMAKWSGAIIIVGIILPFLIDRLLR